MFVCASSIPFAEPSLCCFSRNYEIKPFFRRRATGERTPVTKFASRGDEACCLLAAAASAGVFYIIINQHVLLNLN